MDSKQSRKTSSFLPCYFQDMFLTTLKIEEKIMMSPKSTKIESLDLLV